jgi:hypothetical protein
MRRKQEVAFLKKSSAKNFYESGPWAVSTPREAEESFFCFFFVHKKEDSSFP